jgi:1-acyl-sn-glycerol-3-phosphate acyltransferase
MAQADRSKHLDATEEQARERALIAVVSELVRELNQQSRRHVDVSRSSQLDRDLGIDSLGRTELILRIERALRVRLPIQVLSEANTVGDILDALGQVPADRLAIATVLPPTLPELPLVHAPEEARTLVEALDWHVAEHPDRQHLTVLQDESVVLATLTYGELAKAARAVAAGLLEADVAPGDRIALMLPTGTEFFIAFCGILYAGAVPVPIYPPMQLSKIEEYMRRQAGILRNAGARIVVTIPEGLRFASLLRRLVPTIGAVRSVQSMSAERAEIQLPISRDGAATALIQYTSGSTGDPKGVVLSHANLLANIRAMGRVIEATSADVFVSWLPLYHDMGLIGAWLGSLYFAASFYVMSPLSFLARPQSWLWAMHRFRATISAAPNFAFELCATKIDDADLKGLDLSTLRLLADGAEPVSVNTLRKFTERFGHYGLRPEAMAPVYGLAECAVALAMAPPGRPPIIDRVNRETLSRRGKAEPASVEDQNAIEIVGCGQPLPGYEVRIVGELGREVADRGEGRLEFRGPSATSGYFRSEAKTRALVHDGWLDSGDLAYIANADVFITGRTKDIIIRAGQHIYPHELEDAIGDIVGIRKGGVAVFGMLDPKSGTERMIIVAETDEADPAARESLRAKAQEAATDIVGAPAEEIVLVVPGAVPKTSSGKIRRAAASELYVAGVLAAPRRALRWQMLRLSLASLGPQLSRMSRVLKDRLYAVWWWTVVSAAFAIGWPTVMVLPRVEWRWAVVRWLAKTALAAMGVPISTSGIDRIPRGRAIVMFNHASYADAIILCAVLPDAPTYLAKKELAEQFFAGDVLRRLGALFLERYDLSGSLADTAAATDAAREGRLLVIFPEGTFTRRPGLLGFHLAPFKIACEADLPVFPGVLRGTRSMLRSDQWFPRWGPIAVEVAPPIKPLGTDFASLLELRQRVRDVILAGCGEPDLGELIKPAPMP